MRSSKDNINNTFLNIQSTFPFTGYITDAKLLKYQIIITKIMEEYPPGASILSIGAGPCDLEAILSELNYKVTAVDDLSDQWHLIGKNRERITAFAQKHNVNLIVQSAEIAQLKENCYDVVLMIDIIEHIVGSPMDLINYGISMLKPNGMIIIETPNAVSLINRLKGLFGKSNQVSAGFIFWNIGKYRSHFREYTRSELYDLLQNFNLNATKIELFNIGTESAYYSTKHIVKRGVIFLYKVISGLYPTFKDTIILSGKKPKDWQSLNISLKNFKNFYDHIEKFNIDNISDDEIIASIKKMEL